MGKRFILLSVAVLVFVLVLVAFAGTALASYNFTTHTPDHSKVAGSKHDVSSSGGNPCESCHIPHGAKGAYLWARDPSSFDGDGVSVIEDAGAPGANGSAQYSSDIWHLCYSCHDGTQVFGNGSLLTVGSMTVFSQNGHYNHRTTAASYVPTGSTTATGPGNDCDRCHDPHDDSYWNFLKPEFRTQTYDQTGNVVTVNDGTHGAATLYRWSPLIKGGNFCASCHEGALPDATTATVAAGIPGSRSVHPVYQAAGIMIWDTNNVGTFTWDSTTSSYLLVKPSSTAIVATTPVPGKISTYPSIWPLDQFYMPASGDYQGTRVFNPTTGWMVSAKPKAPALTDGTSVLECESCHAPHGANNGTDSAGVHILNTQDIGTLCSSCH